MKQFGLPIVIRFNSNRESGGAWLVDPVRENASLEIGAFLPIPESVRDRFINRKNKALILDDMWKPTERSAVKVSVQIHVDFLDVPTDLGRNCEYPEWKRGHWVYDTLPEAFTCITSRLDRNKLMTALAPGRI